MPGMVPSSTKVALLNRRRISSIGEKPTAVMKRAHPGRRGACSRLPEREIENRITKLRSAALRSAISTTVPCVYRLF